ncbi:MAG: hypothetical protein ACD_28C00151G0001, partial [uncultured bacterium]
MTNSSHTLRNTVARTEAKKRALQENFKRRTVSFYRYVTLSDPQELRDELFRDWSALGVLGRIYVAREGINAQMSVPETQWDIFEQKLNARPEFQGVPFKFAVEAEGPSFIKLTIKVKHQVVADGLTPQDYNLSAIGTHLKPESFHSLMEEPNAVVVDMRNGYESRIGRFEGAVCPAAETFREELPMVKEMLSGKEDQPVLLYCTGGIRCEKASAYLRHHGFKKVYQLEGGIIQYAHTVREKNLPSKFKGKNFVFDERRAEKITNDVLTQCDQCASPCDGYVNCNNEACNLLFIQCGPCTEQWAGCCKASCRDIYLLPEAERRAYRRGLKIKGVNISSCSLKRFDNGSEDIFI